MPEEPPSPTPPPPPAPDPSPAPDQGATPKPDHVYDLEPAPPPPPPHPALSKLSDKGLIDDMPEDADFTHDPEVERALKGDKGPKSEKSKDATVDTAAEPIPPFVKPGMGDSKTIALVGLGLTIAAILAAALSATNGFISAAVLATYFIAIHSITGLGAVAAAAHLNDTPVGRYDLAAARMLVAVALFMCLMNLGVTKAHFLEPILAAVGYWMTLTILFRLSPGKLLSVAVIHFMSAVAIWMGMVIYSWAATPLATPK